MSHWTFASSPLLILAAIVLGMVSVWFSYKIWTGNAKSRQIMALEAFRLIIICMLLITLLRPERIQVIQWAEEPAVVVLNDVSGSMTTRDVIHTNQVVARQEWISSNLENNALEPLEETSRVLVDAFAEPPNQENPEDLTNVIEGTDLNQALESALQRESNLKAVLVLTDGDWNLGDSPALAAAQYRNQSIPIFAVQVGRESPLPDIELSAVSAPSYGLMGEQISLPFHLHNRMQKDFKFKALLKDGDEIVAEKDVTLPASTDLQETIVWSPSKRRRAQFDAGNSHSGWGSPAG
jgi:multisubunit Na+/H+ antiporter MnhF subunit